MVLSARRNAELARIAVSKNWKTGTRKTENGSRGQSRIHPELGSEPDLVGWNFFSHWVSRGSASLFSLSVGQDER